MNNKLKSSDALWVTAEANIAMADKIGIKLNITQVYTTETCKNLALIAAFMKDHIKTVSGQEIEIINE